MHRPAPYRNRCAKKMKTIIRKIGTFIFGTLCLLAGLLTIIGVTSGGMIEKTIQHSREIEKSFIQAATFVDNFKESHARLPNETEFYAWAKTQPNRAYSANGMTFVTSQDQVHQDVRENFGQPPQDGYVIQFWRGEWNEYYASWANASTLIFEPNKYYFLGSRIADGLLGFSASIFLGLIAYLLWPRTTSR